MRIRPKTARRVLILAAGFCVVAVLIAGVSLLNIRHMRRSTAALRAEAMAAYAGGNYEKAVTQLGQYFDRSKAQESDPDALFAYGKSRISVELPRLGHVYEGIQFFQLYLQVAKPPNPQITEAKKLLLGLYVQAEYNQEAVKLADEILASKPDDVSVLTAKIKALHNQHKYADALEAARTLNRIDPFNLAGQQATVTLMQQAKQRDADVLAYVDGLRSKYPEDPRFEVLTASTYAAMNKADDARKWLHQAAGGSSTDPEFIAELMRQLDNNEMYVDSAALIRRTSQSKSDPRLRRMLVQRLWQDGSAQEVLAQTANIDPVQGDGAVAGFRALALIETGHAAEARQIADALARRGSDGIAIAWSEALHARYSMPAEKLTDQVRELQQAIGREGQNPCFRLMLGEAYREMGETELAIAALKDAAILAPSWAAPHLLASEIFRQTGRYEYALETANDAVRRAPGRADVETARTLAMFSCVWAGAKNVDSAELLQRLQTAQKNGLDPQTISACVRVLARSGKRERADALVQAAIDSSAIPMHTLLELAAVSDAENLGAGPKLRDKAQKMFGLTPEIALTQARVLVESGKAAEGSQLLANASRGHEGEVRWALAIAQYRQLSADPTALKTWIDAGDRFPDNLEVQSAILGSPVRFQDRGLWQRTIDRLKALTGEQGLVWQVERSRWLLAGPLTEKDKGEAVNLLTEVVHAAPTLPEPHRLLAEALEKVNNIPRAIAELTAASDASHADPSVTGELIQLLVANQRSNEALSYLQKLSHNPALGSEAHRRIARQFILLGDSQDAIALLESDRSGGVSAPATEAELADIYSQSGKTEQAEALYRGMLDQASPDADGLAAAADFFAAHQQPVQADMFLQRLAKLSLSAGTLELYQAQFAERWKDSAQATSAYQAATKAAPENSATWASLAGFYLRHLQFDQAAVAAGDGLKATPGVPTLLALQAHAQSLKSLAPATALQPLAELLSRDPLDAGGSDMLKAISDARQGIAVADNMADRAREVADRYPQSIPLQLQAARLAFQAGHLDRAIELARRAATANPANPEPLRMLSHLYLAAADYFHAAETVQQWRQRSGQYPVKADLTAAQIALRQPRRDPLQAIRLLGPYVGRWMPEEQKDQVIALYASALIGAGRSDEAAKLLLPLVKDSARWRATWLELAASGHRDLDSAVDWIKQVAPSVPVDSADEQLALATAWYSVGMQFDSAQSLLRARDLLQPWTQRHAASGPIWQLWAMTAQGLGDLATAEAGYRKALALMPKSAATQNNLAYVLWLRGRDQDIAEALRLAEAAVAAAPENAGFYDTLARVQAANGLQEAAIRTFHTALQKDPGSIEAMIGLADLLSKDLSRRDEVKDLLLQVNRLLPNAPPLSKPLRKQLDDLKSTVALSS